MIFSIAAFGLVIFRHFLRPFFSFFDELLVELQRIDFVVSADAIDLLQHFFLLIFSFLEIIIRVCHFFLITWSLELFRFAAFFDDFERLHCFFERFIRLFDILLEALFFARRSHN